VSLTTSLAIFFLIWWTVLFAVLPWAVRSQIDVGQVAPGTDPGAPAMPRLGARLIWTTVVAAIAFVAVDVIYSYRLLQLEDVAALLGFPKLTSQEASAPAAANPGPSADRGRQSTP
jgi:predicted secreted protein